MKEMFNKDLEGIKKSQYIMNNAITEIKSFLQVTKGRIIEAEDRIRLEEDELWKQMKQRGKKGKELKEISTTSETSGTMINAPTFES